MVKRISSRALTNSRKLRQEATDAERKLWAYLRRDALDDLHFRRQHQVGKYIVDFYCPSKKLVIEVDGSQHAEAANALYDEERTKYLKSRGVRVLRFNNREVLLETDGVFQVILQTLDDPSP